MSRIEKILWIMIIIYTLAKLILGEVYTLLFVLSIIALRIIIWRIGLGD